MPNIFTGAFPQSVSSSDRYGYEGLPPELAAEEQAINRRQQMANFLIQQGLQPAQGQMAGRFYVAPSPLQGLAGLAQVAAGVYGGVQADKARQGVSGKSNEMLQQALQSYQQASGPRTTEGPRPTAMVAPEPVMSGPAPQNLPPVQTELPGPGAPVSTPRPPEEVQQAIIEHLALSRHPQAQRMGELLSRFAERKQEHAESLGLRKEELAAKHEETKALREMQGQQFQMNYDNASRNLDQQYQANMDRLSDARTSHADQVKLTEDQHRIERERLSLDGAKLAREKAPTDAQGAANLFASRADVADKILGSLEGQYSPLAIDYKSKVGKTWVFGGALEAGANAMLSDASQKADQAQRDFVNAVLRKESGAVINPDEFENARKQYFHQQGDGKDVLEQKRQNRQTEIIGLRQMSGALNPAAPKQMAPPATSMTPTVPAFHDPDKQKRYEEFKKKHTP